LKLSVYRLPVDCVGFCRCSRQRWRTSRELRPLCWAAADCFPGGSLARTSTDAALPLQHGYIISSYHTYVFRHGLYSVLFLNATDQ